MKSRLRVLVVLALTVIIPLLVIGVVSYDRQQGVKLNEAKVAGLVVLKLSAATLDRGGDLAETIALVGEDQKLSVYFVSSAGEILLSIKGKEQGDIKAVNFSSWVAQLSESESSGLTSVTGGDVSEMTLMYAKVAGGTQFLFSIIDEKYVETLSKPVKFQVLIFSLSAIVACMATGFLIFGYFFSQIAILGNHLKGLVERQSSGAFVGSLQPEFNEIIQEVDQLQKKQQEYEKQLEALAVTDQLTSVLNTKHILSALQGEIFKVQRYNTPLTAVLLNIDLFKDINQRFGYHIGDQVLSRFSMILQNSLRSHDLVGRYGGDEFLVILPLTDFKYGFGVADRIRNAVEVTYWGEPELQVTVSGGLVQVLDGDAANVLVVLEKLLGQSKRSGRNRIETELFRPE